MAGQLSTNFFRIFISFLNRPENVSRPPPLTATRTMTTTKHGLSLSLSPLQAPHARRQLARLAKTT